MPMVEMYLLKEHFQRPLLLWRWRRGNLEPPQLHLKALNKIWTSGIRIPIRKPRTSSIHFGMTSLTFLNSTFSKDIFKDQWYHLEDTLRTPGIFSYTPENYSIPYGTSRTTFWNFLMCQRNLFPDLRYLPKDPCYLMKPSWKIFKSHHNLLCNLKQGIPQCSDRALWLAVRCQ